MERRNSILETRVTDNGSHTQLGRHPDSLLDEVGFADIEISASYDIYSGPEGRNLITEIVVGRFSKNDYVNRIAESGITTIEELERITKAFDTWPDIPGDFFAHAHCEAIGRKA
jgi:hypothetical protein